MDKQSSNPFKPIKIRRGFEEISDQIRKRIYNRELNPGDRLPGERELAMQFGVGRTAVREALRSLEEGGFIDIRSGSRGGTFIKEPNTQTATRSISSLIHQGVVDFREITEVRIWLERMSLEQAIEKIDAHDIEALEKNVIESENAIEMGLTPRNLNLNFHVLLAKATKNTVHVLIVETVMNVIRDFLGKIPLEHEYIGNIVVSHRSMLEAMKKGNKKLAKSLLTNHLLKIDEKMSSLSKDNSDHHKNSSDIL